MQSSFVRALLFASFASGLTLLSGCGAAAAPGGGGSTADLSTTPNQDLASSGPSSGDLSSADLSSADLAPGAPPSPDIGPPPAQLFAAPTGSGAACTLAAPCSLLGAQTVARQLAPTAAGDLIVNLRGGTYRLAQPFLLDASDSGANGHRVIYAAYMQELPVLNGAVQVTNFALFDSSKQIWRASVPVGTQSRQLYVDGVRAERPHTQRNSLSFTPTAHGLATTSATTTPLAWLHPGMEVAQDNAWKHMRCAIASIVATTDTTPLSSNYPAPSASGVTLVVDPGCWTNNELVVPHPGYPFNGGGVPPSLDNVSTIENVYELLGQNGQTGQFYLDSTAGYVYYVPRSGEDLTKADVELPILEALMDVSGGPGHFAPLNDDEVQLVYNGAWGQYTNRGRGDVNDDVHGTTDATAIALLSFTGTGVDLLSEVDPGEGSFNATLTKTSTGEVVRTDVASANGPTLLAQQVVYSLSGLPKDSYQLTLQKSANDGTWLVLDGVVITSDALTPVHDVAIRGLGFDYATWLAPSKDGYIDNQAGILWDPTTHVPTRIPGALRVHRGQRLEISGNSFAHLGGAGVELADGTQDSTILGNRFDDISGGAVSVGEVDDFWLADSFASGPTRMTSGIAVSDNAVTHTGLDYHDTVAIWVGNSRTTVVQHNVVAHTSYTGISLGWGWGWSAPCNEQSAARPNEPCRRGTHYNGGNRILDNRVYDVMRTLVDGGPIYTLGEQTVFGGITPTVAGNVISAATSCFHMIYHDEGSSYWQTYSNVSYDTGCHWLGVWEPTAHDIVAGGSAANYTDNPEAASDDGTNDTIMAPTLLPFGAWSPAVESLASAAGLEPGYANLGPKTAQLNDSDAALRYSSDANGPQWGALDFRGFGDYGDDVHYATANGAAMWIAFSGSGIAVLGEKDASQGTVEIFVDNVSQGTIDTSQPNGSPRLAQQLIFGVHTLTAGAHMLSLVKRGGSYATIDGVRLDQPVSEITATP
jgi:hypothetical protein